MVSIRIMVAGDVDSAVKIISSHVAVDGKLAKSYYKGYFGSTGRVSSDREQNFVAVADGVVIGVAGHSPDKYDWPDILWLNWLYVHPQYRRRGVGALLLQHVLDSARACGIRKVYLDTDSDESYQPAIRLYEKFGFQEEGRFLDYYEEGEHLIVMGLDIDSSATETKPLDS